MDMFPNLFSSSVLPDPRITLTLQFLEGSFTFLPLVTFFIINNIDPAPEYNLLCYNTSLVPDVRYPDPTHVGYTSALFASWNIGPDNFIPRVRSLWRLLPFSVLISCD